MFADELFENTGSFRLNRLLYSLNALHGVTINFDNTDDATLTSIMEEYESMKKRILYESSFNNYHTSPEYTKASLICEAIRVYLVEIAPKRSRRRKKISK